MRVLLKFELDCTPDAALAALTSPSAFRAVSAPFTTFVSLERDGFPDRWTPGPHLVYGKAFGAVPIGEQVITIAVGPGPDGTTLVHDTGGGVSGMLALVTTWDHVMAVSPLPDGRTLYRDRLIFGAGPLTALIWPAFWAFWQWRGMRIRRLSARWRA